MYERLIKKEALLQQLTNVFKVTTPIVRGNSYYLFLGEPCAAQKIDSFLVTEIYIVTEKKDEQKFTDIFLLLVTIKSIIWRERGEGGGEKEREV